jgi:hypothetical protein
MILEAHYNWVVGHFNIEKIVVMLKKHFYFPKLRQEVSKYIRSFNACVVSKLTNKKQGLQTPLPYIDRPWESNIRGSLGSENAKK